MLLAPQPAESPAASIETQCFLTATGRSLRCTQTVAVMAQTKTGIWKLSDSCGESGFSTESPRGKSHVLAAANGFCREACQRTQRTDCALTGINENKSSRRTIFAWLSVNAQPTECASRHAVEQRAPRILGKASV
ncbi:hypothetical protein SKAU_G00070790 [Synaphobranchus kaupii]|uniref:Uncharacterized protein n=1 Tax=Synaphobranchus kaupii TaxID=118154 RepID=A0A9Q1J9H9_SYNKA|nr:hypothetical protein SKAU_G00070790 [Synaphobranchus kaupii]